MSGMNSQVHFQIETPKLNKLREEAEDLDISLGELIRRKVEEPPKGEELILLRKMKEVFNTENGGDK